jgi:hypothetical protein
VTRRLASHHAPKGRRLARPSSVASGGAFCAILGQNRQRTSPRARRAALLRDSWWDGLRRGQSVHWKRCDRTGSGAPLGGEQSETRHSRLPAVTVEACGGVCGDLVYDDRPSVASSASPVPPRRPCRSRSVRSLTHLRRRAARQTAARNACQGQTWDDSLAYAGIAVLATVAFLASVQLVRHGGPTLLAALGPGLLVLRIMASDELSFGCISSSLASEPEQRSGMSLVVAALAAAVVLLVWRKVRRPWAARSGDDDSCGEPFRSGGVDDRPGYHRVESPLSTGRHRLDGLSVGQVRGSHCSPCGLSLLPPTWCTSFQCSAKNAASPR